jgi:hypothetical protein
MFPIVRIRLSTYISLVRRYSALVWESGKPLDSITYPSVGFVYCQYTGRILAYPIEISRRAVAMPGSWYHLGAIGHPFFDQSLLEYRFGSILITGDSEIHKGYVGWYRYSDAWATRRLSGKLVTSSYSAGTPVHNDAREHVLYEIVVVPDDAPEDLSELLRWSK